MNNVPIQLLIPITVLTSLTLVILLFMVHPFLGVAVPVAFLLAIMVSRPKRALAIFWGFTILVPSIEIIMPSILVKILEHGMFVLLTGILAGSFVLGRNRMRGSGFMVVALAALLVIALLSLLVNHSPPKMAIYFSLIYFKHFIIFLYVQQFCDAEDAGWMFRIIIITILIQFFFSALYLAGLNPLPLIQGRVSTDSFTGSIGDAHHVGYFMIFFMLLMMKVYNSGISRFYRVLAALALVLAFAQFFITYTMHAYFYLAFAFGLFFILHGQSFIIQMLKLTGVAALVTAVGVLLFSISPERRVSAEILDPRGLEHRLHKTLSGPKMLAYKEVFLDSGEHLPQPLLGGGPGNYTSILAYDNRRPRAFMPHMIIHYSDIFRNLTYSGSLLSSPRSGFITIYGELGPFGFLIYWGVFVYVVWVVYKQVSKKMYHSRVREILATVFIPSMLVLLLLNIFVDSVRALHLNLGLWIWASMIWRPCEAPEESDEETSSEERPASSSGVSPSVKLEPRYDA